MSEEVEQESTGKSFKGIIITLSTTLRLSNKLLVVVRLLLLRRKK